MLAFVSAMLFEFILGALLYHILPMLDIAFHPSASVLERGDGMAGKSMPGEAGMRFSTFPWLDL